MKVERIPSIAYSEQAQYSGRRLALDTLPREDTVDGVLASGPDRGHFQSNILGASSRISGTEGHGGAK